MKLTIKMSLEESQAWRPDLEGWSDDILPFYRALVKSLDTFGEAVEVGCYFGRSLCFLIDELARELRSGWVTGIEPGKSDPLQQYEHGPEVGPGHNRNVLWDCREVLEQNLERFSHSHAPIQTRIIRLPSLAASFTFDDHSLDLVFLDGDHREESVRADIEAWRPKIRPGGWLAGHDYGFHLYPGVRKVVDEIFPGAEIYGSCWAVQL